MRHRVQGEVLPTQAARDTRGVVFHTLIQGGVQVYVNLEEEEHVRDGRSSAYSTVRGLATPPAIAGQ